MSLTEKPKPTDIVSFNEARQNVHGKEVESQDRSQVDEQGPLLHHLFMVTSDESLHR